MKAIESPHVHGMGDIAAPGGIRCKANLEFVAPAHECYSEVRTTPILAPCPKPLLAYHSAKAVNQRLEFPSPRMGCRKPESVTSFLCLIRSCVSQDAEIKAPCACGQINQFRPPHNGNQTQAPSCVSYVCMLHSSSGECNNSDDVLKNHQLAL